MMVEHIQRVSSMPKEWGRRVQLGLPGQFSLKNKKLSRRLGAVLIATSVASMFTPTAALGADAPHPGGGVTIADIGLSSTIDPAFNFISSNTDEPTVEAVYGPGLVYLDPNTGAVKMGFAKSLTSHDGGKTWRLVLRPGLKFSDGTAFNAAAVAYNIARDANPATGSTLETDASQLKTKVLGPTTLQIVTTPPDADLPVVMSQDFAMVGSPSAIKKEGKNFGTHPVGPGPFAVKSFELGTSWTFTRNPHYASFAAGQPYLDTLTVVDEPAQDQVLTAMQSGQAQATEMDSEQQVQQERRAGMTVITPTQPSRFFLDLNTSIPPFNNLLAREAVYYALDRSAVANVWQPGNPVATNLFSPGSPYYSSKNNFPGQNITKAQQLFNELAAQGKPVKFSVVWPTGSTGNAGAYIQGALAKFKNVTVTDDGVPVTQYHQQLAASGFQMTAYSMSSQNPGAFQLFSSNGTLNYGKFKDPTIDKDLAQIRSTANQTKLKTLWDAVQREIIRQYPVVWLQEGVQGYAYNKATVGGIKLTEYGQVALFGSMYRK